MAASRNPLNWYNLISMKDFAAKWIGACLLAAAALPAATRQPVRARHAMVVTREDHATQVGLKILEEGGNAVDAAVAVGFALAVTHPAAGNLGGGGFMLIRFEDGRSTFIDFRERAPEAATRDMYVDREGNLSDSRLIGYRASAVPGTVRGLEYAWRKYGRRPWASLVAPAVELAAKGFPVSYGLARSLRASKVLERFADSRRIFQRNGRFFEPDEILVQPELAATLERIAKSGSHDFYEGETARRLAEDMSRHGGLITPGDLKRYEVVEREPLRGSYHGCDIVTAPPPSSGGAGILQMMYMLDGTGYQKSGAGSAASIHYIAETMRRFFADRAAYFGDPDFVKIPLAELLSQRYVEERRRSIRPDRATPSSAIRAGTLPGAEKSETTHYSIVDAEGNAAAVTYTLNGGYGSGVTAEGLGFLLNNEMDDFTSKEGAPNMFGLLQGAANAIQPRKRPLSAMTPTIVTRDGKLFLVLGSPGGPTIISTVLLVVLNVIDFGMDIQQAVDWPRFHHQWMPDQLRLEQDGFSPDTIALLEERGHHVQLHGHQGEVAAIAVQNGWLLGAPDSRSEGTARGY
jgi:gamma-glutamyltranspeptidase/glutathione hydrolase